MGEGMWSIESSIVVINYTVVSNEDPIFGKNTCFGRFVASISSNVPFLYVDL